MTGRAMRFRGSLIAALTALVVTGLPRVVLACPVCFSASDSPMANGMNMAILVLLGITGGVLVGFATFFVYLMRRARMTAAPAHGGDR